MHAILLVVWLWSCGSAPGGPSTTPLPGAPPWSDSVRDAVRRALEAPSASPRTRHLDAGGRPLYTNRLILEQSPYLLQHAHNPVDWQPWGEAAFEQARALDRPIFLSIGYSTCHWCHVMEEESFEDLEIARQINAHFVAIKVDREERPDVDAVYMQAVLAMRGRGGWPMTLVLRPDRVPFFAATYLPPRAGVRGASKGLSEVLAELADRWARDRDNLDTIAAELSRRMDQLSRAPAPEGAPGVEALGRAVADYEAAFDPRHGGFGPPPRFPQAPALRFLLREHRRTGSQTPLQMVLRTLDAMAEGGLRDPLGGGFHRYATDADWAVPHFEKMLYDQAQLAEVYTEAWQASGEARYRDIARETLDFVLREMRHPDGAFYTAFDADSPGPEGEREEGRFYTWTPGELDALLPPEDAALARAWYGVGPEGHLDGRTVLSNRRTVEQVAAERGRSVDATREDLARIRRALYQARRERPPPLLDDKIVLAWNALTIRALARASFAFDEPVYGQAARRAARFVARRMTTEDGGLVHTWRGGQPGHRAVLDDYALYADALLALFQATGEADWLHLAGLAADQMDRRFGDPTQGGWYGTPEGADDLLVRAKPWSDGALPSGNGVAIGVHLQLYELTGEVAHRETADRALGLFGGRLARYGTRVPTLLGWLGFRLGQPRQVVVLPGTGREEMLAVLRTTWQPHKVQIPVPHGVEFSLGHLSLVAGKAALGGATTAYVCHEGVCELPVTEPEAFRERLLAPPAAPGAIAPRPAEEEE